MKIIKEFPPNIEQIRQAGLSDKNTIFAYGNIIYNPYKKEIPDDVMFHEAVHVNQQGNNPDVWWTRYVLDKDFRQNMEVEAYARQYNVIRKTHTTKAAQQCLEECAYNLSSKVYQLDLTYHQAFTKIRKYVKLERRNIF